VTDDPTIFVVDDDMAVRKSLDMLLRSVGYAVETFASAREFLDAYDSDRPGCLVLDVRMPGMSGLELQSHLKAMAAGPPIIIVTAHGDVPIAVRAMKNGALDFLEKPYSKQLLLEHIREALKKDQERREHAVRRSEAESRLASLTNREREVMERVVAGKASKQIAAEFGISKKTIDVHRGRVMKKMQVETVAELVELVVSTRQDAPPSAGAEGVTQVSCDG
jgi:FixJ family two-component response regulator